MTIDYIAKPITAQQMLEAMAKARTQFADKLAGELKLSGNVFASHSIDMRATGANELYEGLLDEIGKLLNS